MLNEYKWKGEWDMGRPVVGLLLAQHNSVGFCPPSCALHLRVHPAPGAAHVGDSIGR